MMGKSVNGISEATRKLYRIEYKRPNCYKGYQRFQDYKEAFMMAKLLVMDPDIKKVIITEIVETQTKRNVVEVVL